MSQGWKDRELTISVLFPHAELIDIRYRVSQTATRPGYDSWTSY